MVVETFGRREESAVIGTALARHKVEVESEKPRHLYMILYFSFDICENILRLLCTTKRPCIQYIYY